MKMIISVCLLSLLAFCAAPARAGILPGPFPWGISMAEMLAEVSDDFTPEVRGGALYLNLGYGFCGACRAKIRFGDKGLEQVRYEVRPVETEEFIDYMEFLKLLSLLREQYGEPAPRPPVKEHPDTEAYYWETAAETVALTAHGGKDALELVVLAYTAKPLK